MSEDVLIAIVGAISAGNVALIAVFAPIIARKLHRTHAEVEAVKDDTAATKDQVVNHHQTNFREDVDEIKNDMSRFMRSTTHMLHDLLELGSENRQRIIALEDTEISERKRK